MAITELKNQQSSMNIHPGELLRDEIESRGVSQRELAESMGVSCSLLSEIVNAKRAINTEYALLLEAALGTPAYIWIRLQEEYDLREKRSNPTFLQRLAAVRRVAAVL